MIEIVPRLETQSYFVRYASGNLDPSDTIEPRCRRSDFGRNQSSGVAVVVVMTVVGGERCSRCKFLPFPRVAHSLKVTGISGASALRVFNWRYVYAART